MADAAALPAHKEERESTPGERLLYQVRTVCGTLTSMATTVDAVDAAGDLSPVWDGLAQVLEAHNRVQAATNRLEARAYAAAEARRRARLAHLAR